MLKTLLFLALPLFFLRCTVFLPLTGALVDAAVYGPQTDSTELALAELKPGKRIRIIDSENREYVGIYRGMRMFSASRYAILYNHRAAPDSLRLPLLDSLIGIRTASGDSLNVIFEGFDYQAIRIRESLESDVYSIRLGQIESFSTASSGMVDLAGLRHCLESLQVPVYSYIELTDFERQMTFSPYAVTQIEGVKSKAYISVLMAVGLLVDVVVFWGLRDGLSSAFEGMGH